MIISETLNVELLRTVRDFLTDHPQRHDQGVWMDGQVAVLERDPALVNHLPELEAALEAAWRDDTCNTTGCVAGWASLFAGYRQIGASDEVYDPTDRNRTTDMRTAAKLALGLSDYQADALFWGVNSLAAIDGMIDRMIADPNDHLEDLVDAHDRV